MNTLFYNAKVYVDPGDYREAVLVRDGRIEAVGSNAEVAELADKLPSADTERIDCGGRTLIPGLNDAHLHLLQLGETLRQADLTGVRSIDEMVARCRKFLDEHPEEAAGGLHASGWNQDLFEDDQRVPDRHDLDRISTEIPVFLERVCGHMAVANSCLVEQVDFTSPELKDGEWQVGTDGRPNGVFTESACNLVKKLLPERSPEQQKELLLEAMRHAASLGITSVQTNDLGTVTHDYAAGFRMLHEIYDEDLAPVRYRHQVSFDSLEDFRAFLQGEFLSDHYDDRLTLGPLKLFRDGSLGARTAMLTDGYRTEPDNHGQEWISDEEMTAFCQLARDHGIQVAAHAIGDEAIRRTLNCFEKAFVDGQNSLRHTIIHCQITDEALQDRIVRLGVPVSVQPVFIDYDRTIVRELCGEELARTSYAFGTLVRKGAHVAYGTDCPVEPCDPFLTLYMAVSRRGRDGLPEGGFYPAERVDVETAIDCYTAGSAYQEFAEDRKGRILPGYYADLVLLDRDIFTVPEDEIREIRPVLTMTCGKIVYQR